MPCWILSVFAYNVLLLFYCSSCCVVIISLCYINSCVVGNIVWGTAKFTSLCVEFKHCEHPYHKQKGEKPPMWCCKNRGNKKVKGSRCTKNPNNSFIHEAGLIALRWGCVFRPKKVYESNKRSYIITAKADSTLVMTVQSEVTYAWYDCDETCQNYFTFVFLLINELFYFCVVPSPNIATFEILSLSLRVFWVKKRWCDKMIMAERWIHAHH